MRYGRKHAGKHLVELRRIYGYKMFSGRSTRDLKVWLEDEAEPARSNEGLARRFVEEWRRRQVILPGPSVLERLCANALVAAERRIETRIAAGLDDAMRRQLDCLPHRGSGRRHVPVRVVTPVRGGGGTRPISTAFWTAGVPAGLRASLWPAGHRSCASIARLRSQGERYFAEGLRDISSDRRLAILGVCVVE